MHTSRDNKKKSSLKWTALITFFGLTAVLSFTFGHGSSWIIAPGISLLVTLILVAMSRRRDRVKRQKEQPTYLPPVSAEREVFYQSRGLSPEDITFFRQTMNEAKKHVLTIEQSMTQNSKLHAIERRYNVIHLCKKMFNNITDAPERLHDVNDFLYESLPSLATITSKYDEIDRLESKSKVTFDVLTQTEETIEQLAEQVEKEYLAFHQLNVADLKSELDYATYQQDTEILNQKEL